MKDSNQQNTGLKAAMSFPGNLWWILPLVFLLSIGGEYWFSAYDAEPFHPLWVRILAITIFGGALAGFIVGVIKSNKNG